ncbi:MAG: molybdopterin-dependent oxidoreductase [Solirubrobacteraceae bacterium]
MKTRSFLRAAADDGGALLGRRAFLGAVGVGASSVLWGGAASTFLSEHLQGLTSLLPGGLRAALPTPGGGWRIYSVNPPMPTFDPARWRLRIDGLVERPVELTYRQLLALPRVQQTSDFHCVTGWSVLGVRWTGVRIQDLLSTAGPLPSARALTFVSAERGYVDALTLEQLAAPDAMLAYGMEGRPLSRDHGAPARVVMPRMYGYKGVKWLARIVVADRPLAGYWEQRGYDQNAWLGHSNGYG